MGKKSIPKVRIEIPLPEITGDRQKDRQTFQRCRSVDVGIQLLEYYAPRNYRLIAYCKAVRDIKYITENLNAILHGNN